MKFIFHLQTNFPSLMVNAKEETRTYTIIGKTITQIRSNLQTKPLQVQYSPTFLSQMPFATP